MKKFKIIIFSLCATCLSISCSNDDDNSGPNNDLSDEKMITSFTFDTESNPELTSQIDLIINEDEKTICVNIPNWIDRSELTPQIEISEGATVSPEGANDFSFPVEYSVTA